jgi:hypothetical protein
MSFRFVDPMLEAELGVFPAALAVWYIADG